MAAHLEPPVEWVRGDPVRAAQFGALVGVLQGAVIVLSIEYFLALFNAISTSPLPPPVPWGLLCTIIAMALVGVVVRLVLPRRFPVIASLGISPANVQVVFPTLLGRHRIRWSDVRVGPGRIANLDSMHAGERYCLTDEPMGRLANFLRMPLPSGAAVG